MKPDFRRMFEKKAMFGRTYKIQRLAESKLD